MNKLKHIILGAFIGIFIVVLTYFLILMYRAIAFNQAYISSIDSYLKEQIEKGILELPVKETEK